VITVKKVRYVHPWVHVGVVVFADDTLGMDIDGSPLKVEHDVVVTGMAAEQDGMLVAYRRFDGPLYV
jgi:hypothetical protein